MPAPFFIVGSPRSGTTLLQSMLMCAEGVFIPPETQFMGMLWARRAWVGDIRSDAGWERAVSAIKFRSNENQIGLDAEAFDRLVSLPSGPERTYAALLSAWLEAIRLKEGAAVIGEKSPIHAAYVLELAAALPGSKFVQIIRDVRDVCVSQKEQWKKASTLHVAMRWRRDLTRHLACEQLLPADRYHSLRYEKLVTDAEGVIRPLCDFLGLAFRPEMLEPQRRRKAGFASHETHKLRTLEPVTASRVGRFKEKLSGTDLAVLETFCGELMDRLGYERVGAGRLRGWIGAGLQAVPMALLKVRQRRFVQEKMAKRPDDDE